MTDLYYYAKKSSDKDTFVDSLIRTKKIPLPPTDDCNLKDMLNYGHEISDHLKHYVGWRLITTFGSTHLHSTICLVYDEKLIQTDFKEEAPLNRPFQGETNYLKFDEYMYFQL